MICALKRWHCIDHLFNGREKPTGGTGRLFQMSDVVLSSGGCVLIWLKKVREREISM